MHYPMMCLKANQWLAGKKENDLKTGCFYKNLNSYVLVIFWTMNLLSVLLIISNNFLSKAVINWCWGFLRQQFCTARGGGCTCAEHRELACLACVSNWNVCLSVCLSSVCQTCQRWSHTTHILLQRRGGPASLTCPPTLLMKETTPGRMDESYARIFKSQNVQTDVHLVIRIN